MAPKIEEIKPITKPNPFLPAQKKKTIRRDAKEIYSVDKLRQGLNKPQYLKGTPLDKLFLDLEEKLNRTIDEITLAQLTERLIESTDDENNNRYLVVSKLLDYLIQIQQLSLNEPQPDSNLISISLHDIKTFSKLLNLIIIHGVYPGLNTFKIGIPLAKRRTNYFSKTKKPIKTESLIANTGAKNYTERFQYNEKLLTLIYDKLKLVFETESDVKDLLIKGTGYSDFLTISITLITCPYFNQTNKSKYLLEFENFVLKLPSTFELFQTFTLYLSSQSATFFKQFVVRRLHSLHYDAPKGDGLLSLIEFVLGLRETDDVNIEKFDNVATIISSKPKEISTTDYFSNIGTQCFELLVNINRPYVTSCAGHIIERLWLKNRLVVQDFFLKPIWNNLDPKVETKDENGILISEKDFNNSINALISLTKKGLTTELNQFVFKPIILSLWAYFVFLKKNSKSTDILANILAGYFTSVEESEDIEDDLFGLDKIAKNLTYDGSDWEYSLGVNDLPQIVEASQTLGQSKEQKINKYLSDLDKACESYIALLKDLDGFYVLKIFKRLLQRWLHPNNTIGDDSSPFIVLLDLRLIEAIANEFKENIAETPEEMLEIVDDFLRAQSVSYSKRDTSPKDSDDEDSDDETELEQDVNFEAMPVLLELLSAILTEISESEVSKEAHSLLERVMKSLKVLSKKKEPLVTQNLKTIEALGSRIQLMVSGETKVSQLSTKEIELRSLKRAVASLNDPLVPIRAHGLYLLRQLIDSGSDVVPLDFAIELHLVQLKDPEPFIYLNVIKGLQSLIDSKGIEVLKILTNLYLGQDDDTGIDERLKIGEVLLRYIQSSNELFSGEAADLIVTASLSIIRRQKEQLNDQDTRLRMSAMSLLGVCCKTNILGVINHLSDILDCAFGILNLELDTNSSVMRRSAVVLIHDIIMGTGNTSDTPYPEEYRQKTINILNYIVETDNDVLTREQAQIVLGDIQELITLAQETLNQ